MLAAKIHVVPTTVGHSGESVLAALVAAGVVLALAGVVMGILWLRDRRH